MARGKTLAFELRTSIITHTNLGTLSVLNLTSRGNQPEHSNSKLISNLNDGHVVGKGKESRSNLAEDPT